MKRFARFFKMLSTEIFKTTDSPLSLKNFNANFK